MSSKDCWASCVVFDSVLDTSTLCKCSAKPQKFRGVPFIATSFARPSCPAEPPTLHVCERGEGRRPPLLNDVLRSCHTSYHGLQREDVRAWTPALRRLCTTSSLCSSHALGTLEVGPSEPKSREFRVLQKLGKPGKG